MPQHDRGALSSLEHGRRPRACLSMTKVASSLSITGLSLSTTRGTVTLAAAVEQ